VPAATVGVVLVDGVVDRVWPPGERTTVGLFERVANFFLGRERTAFYLVDQRPFPVPFVLRSKASATGRSVKTQVLVTFTLPRGDKDKVASFIANTLGDRPAFAAGDLYNLLRPEVVRVAEQVLDRAVAAAPDGDISYPDAEQAIRAGLAAALEVRYGLTVDATLAPLTAIASLNVKLGDVAAPKVRPCAACRHELPVSLRFCDRCGAKQAVGGAGAAGALFSADGQQLELDLIVRVQGQHDDFSPDKIAPALGGAAAAYLRGVAYPALTAPGGFATLEETLTAAAGEALGGFGLHLVALAVVDLRTKTGEWLLAARADLERAREDVKLGRAWLEQRDGELDLEELTVARALRQQAITRDAKLAEDTARVVDREQRQTLADREARMATADAQRDGAVRAAAAEVARGEKRRELDFAGEVIGKEGERARSVAQTAADVRRIADAAEVDALRARENVQLDKLRAMAELERQATAQEQEHELEKRRMLKGLTPEEMIALQAAELAKAEGGGAAWAEALAGKELRAQTERQRAGEADLYKGAMAAMADVAKSRAEGPLVSTVAPAAAATKPCASCGAPLRPDAKFCGACGTGQP
jgi:hypothetical protein